MPGEPTVRPGRPADAAAWLRLRRTLWPEGSEPEHRHDIEEFFAGRAPEQAVLFAEDGAGQVLGFVELSIRPCAEGCRTNRVAPLEGWFVIPEARGRGVGRTLVTAAEDWGRARTCSRPARAAGTTRDGAVPPGRELRSTGEASGFGAGP
jgi:aminoglycoside 6'-N-acetyltransferase I